MLGWTHTKTEGERPKFTRQKGTITMAVISLPQAVEQFVSATNAHDADALFAVFAPEAVVVDDGATFATEAELRKFIKNQDGRPQDRPDADLLRRRSPRRVRRRRLPGRPADVRVHLRDEGRPRHPTVY